jgi:hypothetical protein
MLDRLRHYAVVGGYDKQQRVQLKRRGDHIFDEFFVPGRVDKRYGRVRFLKMTEAKIKRYAARFLLLRLIAIKACQSLYKRGFAVIDMSRRADYKPFQLAASFAAAATALS